MKEQDKIPSSKVQRATRFIRTGAKVGRNYAVHYTKKIFDKDLERSELDAKNAEDIYGELSQLKGGALKIAQMLSMDKGMLPREYTRKFANAQYSAPPLSAPLVVKTFKEQFGKSPSEIFDEFDLHATHAASIGQVHKAKLNGKTLAVKIQYPGVADAIVSDLRMVRPIARRIAKVSDADIGKFFAEVQERLIEETDYRLELKNAMEIGAACAHIPHLRFPKYYPELSGERILTMEWLEGMHMKEFMETNPSDAVRNQIGQALWDFTNYQLHVLGKVHADPHPGNFLLTPDGKLGVLDFGCVKVVPPDFYRAYFSVIHPNVRNNPERLLQVTYALELLNEEDTESDREFVLGVLNTFLSLVERPFFSDSFDFGDDAYLDALYKFGMEVGRISDVQQKHGGRGSAHAIYVNRTFFGLISLLNDLKVTINSRDQYISKMDL
ncbi:MAG TPA: AarF/ABC1/UbiB kinase family protein [Bacteroidia bacterium]|nr:AarF/ABC1/UbiB kinase family protein [Bacteroidia bacterium]